MPKAARIFMHSAYIVFIQENTIKTIYFTLLSSESC